MPSSTLTSLSAASALSGPELIYGVQSGGDVKITTAQVQTFALGNSFTQFTGPTSSAKTFTLPDASSTILTTNAAVTVAQGGTGASTFTTHGVLVGEGTGAFAALSVGATGTLLAGATGADPAFSATPTLGANGGTGGAVTFKGSTSGSVALQVAAAAGTGTVFQLPATNGTSGWVLQTDGNGVTSWVAASGGAPGGSTTQLQYNNASAFAGASGLTTDGTNLTLGSSSQLLWSTDLILTRNAAAKLQLGAADAASPVAQTLLAQSVVTGTSNTAGANLTIAGSKGTGTGVGGSIIFQVAPAGTTGTSPNALATALTIDSTKTLTIAGSILGGGSNPTTIQQSYIQARSIMSVNASGNDTAGLFATASQTGLVVGGGATIAFTSSSDVNGATSDLFMSRSAAATLQHGAADAAAPVAQIVQAQSVVAGTSNTAGTDWTLQGSRGTGTGVGGDIVLKTAPAGTTGTAQNAAAEVIRILNTGNVKFTNAANFSANGSVATSITSVGPTGANTTAQEWLTIKNASGTTRYIPCF